MPLRLPSRSKTLGAQAPLALVPEAGTLGSTAMANGESPLEPARDLLLNAPPPGNLGFRTVCDPPDAEYDICLIHGLNGSRDGAWTHSNGHFWPKSLGKEFPKARILTYGYNADMLAVSRPRTCNSLRGNGAQFALDTANARVEDETRPLYFVAHSLGGLVLKQALLNCREPADRRLEYVLKSTRGIIFMGTPHQGADLADDASSFARLMERLNLANANIVSELKAGSEVRIGLQEGFERLLSSLKNNERGIDIFCCYEAHGYANMMRPIVPESSAVMPNCQKGSIDANHVKMVKFASMDDPGFKLLKAQILSWLRAHQPQEDPAAASNTTPSSPSQTEQQLAAQAGSTFWHVAGSVYNIGNVSGPNIRIGGG